MATYGEYDQARLDQRTGEALDRGPDLNSRDYVVAWRRWDRNNPEWVLPPLCSRNRLYPADSCMMTFDQACKRAMALNACVRAHGLPIEYIPANEGRMRALLWRT